MDPLDPRFEEWRRQQMASLESSMQPPDPMAGFQQAVDADRGARKTAGEQAYLASLVGGLLRQRPMATPAADDSAVKEWVLSKRVSDEAAQAPLDAEWKRAQIERMTAPRVPSQPKEDPLSDLKREKMEAEIARLRRPPAERAPRPVNEAAAAREERAKAGAVYGGKYFKLRADVPPGSLDEIELRKVREASGEVADLAAAADEVSSIYKRTGGQLTGPDAARMRSLITDMQLTAKGPSVYQLGVLAGPDMEILDTMLANPAKLDSVLRNAADLRNFVTEIETFKRRVLERTASKADALGFDPIAGPFMGVRRPGAAPATAGNTVRVRRKADGKVGSMPAEKFNPDLYEKIQ